MRRLLPVLLLLILVPCAYALKDDVIQLGNPALGAAHKYNTPPLIGLTVESDGQMRLQDVLTSFTLHDLLQGAFLPNAVKSSHIDWGTGTNQVSTDDIPEGAVKFYHEAAVDSVIAAQVPALVQSGITATVPTLISEAAPGLSRSAWSTTITAFTYDEATGILSLADGHYVPTTAERDAWNAAIGVSAVRVLTFTVPPNATGSTQHLQLRLYTSVGNFNADAATSFTTDAHVLRKYNTALTRTYFDAFNGTSIIGFPSGGLDASYGASKVRLIDPLNVLSGPTLGAYRWVLGGTPGPWNELTD